MLTRTLRSLALVIACCLSTAGVAIADPPQRPIDIPAGDLNIALERLSKQSGSELVFRPEQVKGLKTKGVHGTLTTPEAVKRLLEGTGLELSTDSTGAMLIAAPQTAAHGTTTRLDPTTTDAFGATRLAQSTSTSTQSQAGPDVAQNASGPDPRSRDQTPGLDEIVVTGTNITGVENKTIPMLVFDRDAIDRSGYATTADFIDSLPQNVKSGGNSADGVLTGLGLSNVENSTAANLRGLGSNSTLTLLNGHRVAPSSYGTGVDLSMIPLSAVERIEVLTDGSSAVYGADAVGGVINIILRKDFNGQETSARFDALSQGGGEQKQIGQSIGRTWSTGGVLAVLQFQDSNAIHTDQRTFTQNLPEPTDIYPSSKRYSGVFSGHQTLTDTLDVFADALIEHNDGFRAYNTGGDFAEIELIKSKTDSQSANIGIRWQPFGDWHLEGSTLFSQVNTLATEDLSPPAFGYNNGDPLLRNLFTIKEADLKLDGTLWAAGGSSVKGAVGGSYRREDFSSFVPFEDVDRPLNRRVSAIFAEAYAPLISSENAVTLVRKLEFSAAVRKDSYSDFGGKTNPRFGVFWSPIDALGLRAAYSTSFRAPNPFENLSTLSATTAYVEPGFALPNGTAGNVLFFANPVLVPETSKNLSAGLDFQPPAIAGTRFSFNYYRIVYSNRIINSPSAADVFINPQVYGPLVQQFASDAAAAAFIAGKVPPQTLVDLTPGGTGLAGVRFGFPYGDINAAKQTTEGFDLGSHSLLTIAGANKIVLDFNATYIRELETAFCNGCTSTDLVNTYGEPLRFRARGAAGWSNGVWSTNTAVNFSNGYSDTNIAPFGHISSFTTADLNVGFHAPWLLATTIGFSVTNLFNTDPPRTSPAFNSVAYDPLNADARGRIVSLQVRVQW